MILTRMATTDLFEANELIHNDPQKAMLIYDKVVKKRHPIAYLNRSMCFLALQRPELAVIDAQLAYELGRNGKDRTTRAQISHYAKACENSGIKRDRDSILSQLISNLNPPPAIRLANLSFDRNTDSDMMVSVVEIDILQELRARAAFRLALALWKLGGGAARTALTILERASLEFPATRDFSWLGSIIASNLQEQFDQERVDETRMSALRQLMATRCTFLSSSCYDIKERDLQTINTSIKKLDATAVIQAINSNEDELVLVSTEDIHSGDVLFTENAALTVCSASTEDDAHHFCETCTATILIPDGLFDPAPTLRALDRQTKDLVLSTTEEIIETHLDGCEVDIRQSQERYSTPPTSDFRSQASPRSKRDLLADESCREQDMDLRVCECCQNAIFWCCQSCQNLALKTHHSLLCGSDLDEFFRRVLAIRDIPGSVAPKAHERVLTTLLLSRLLSWCQTDDTKPLEHPATVLLSAACQGRMNEKCIPWSYDTHVVAPLEILRTLDAARTGIVYHLSRDGGVINRLINLIHRQIRISQTQAWSMKYDSQGKFVESQGRVDGVVFSHLAEGGTPTTIEEAECLDTDAEIFYGSLHPLCGLLRTTAERATSNVELVDVGEGRTICIPTQAVVHVGEPLVLASRSVRPGTPEEREMYCPKKQASETSCDNSDADVADTLMAFEADEENYVMMDASSSDDTSEEYQRR